MRTINQVINSDRFSLTKDEVTLALEYIEGDAKYILDSYSYSCLLGWWVLGDQNIPLSTKEAGLTN